jgi:thiol:disulfide interchange protein DsbD
MLARMSSRSRWLCAWIGFAALAALAAARARASDASIEIALPPAPPGATGRTAFDAGDPRVEVRLLSDTQWIAPGQPFRVGALFTLAPGWHLYWKNPGDTGATTEFELASPQLEAGPIEWPAPKAFVFDAGEMVNYGYEREVLLWREVRYAPAAAGGATQRIDAALRFLVCRIECVPGELALALPIALGGAGDAAEPAPAPIPALFDRYAALRPVPAAAFGVATRVQCTREVLRPGDRFGLSIEVEKCVSSGRDCSAISPAFQGPLEVFLPERADQLTLRATGMEALGEGRSGLRLQVDGRASADPPSGDARLRAVLALRDAGGALRHVEIEATLPRGPALGPGAGDAGPPGGADGAGATGTALGLAGALGFGLLGGLLLNAMPCVLPVLAVKLFALVEAAGRSRRDALAAALAYLAGVVASLLALAGLVLALRVAGTAVGWGFQFQEPRYVAALAALCFLLALDLFGFYAFGAAPNALAGIGSRASGPLRSLFDGLLVVVLATPCSAPFLGAALGFAFAGSPAQILAVFAAIGVGLALPFALAAAVPGLLAFLPRPGAWMGWLRSLLGAALLATTGWLLWILGGSAGRAALAALALQLALLAAAALAFGRAQRDGRIAAARAALALGACLFIAGPALLPSEARVVVETVPAAGAGAPARRPFAREAVTAAVAQGRPAFVIFTADWCLTCKLNERAVLADARVESELAARGFEVFVADWTRRDEAIRAELARHGRAGVPLYLVYAAQRPDAPVLLSEVLTVEGVLRVLRGVADARSGPA